MRRNTQRGMLIIDILLALSLGAVFVTLVTQSTFISRDMFYRSKERARLLGVYEAHAAEFDTLMPYESRSRTYSSSASSTPDTIDAVGYWYGNDRVESVISVKANSISSSTVYNQVITFNQVRLLSPIIPQSVSGSSVCSPDFSNRVVGSYAGNISNQQNILPHITAVTLPLPPTIQLTDLIVRKGIAYISADSTTQSDPDIFVVDISNPTSTSLYSSINTGPGISAIAVANTKIYAAAASTAAQLHIIAMPNLYTLLLEKKFQLPLPYATATPPIGSSIFFSSHRVYLGTDKWDGDEFSIIDVTNPASPTKLGGYEINSKVNSIFLRNTNAYIATADQKQLSLLDSTDSSHPFSISSFSPSGWERQAGNSVSVFEDRPLLGRNSGGFNIAQDHELFSWATTSQLTFTSPQSADISGGTYGIVADRFHVFVATRTIGKELSIFDNSLSTTTARYYSLPSIPQAMTCDNNRLYILSHSAPVIYQIEFSPE